MPTYTNTFPMRRKNSVYETLLSRADSLIGNWYPDIAT